MTSVPLNCTALSTSLPYPANIVAHFDASTLGLTNGTSVASWADSVNGIAATQTSGSQPTYVTNRLNGLPSVQFSGTSQWLAIASPGVLKTAIDSLDYTIFIVFRTLGSGGGALFGASVGNSSMQIVADGTNVSSNAAFSGFTVPYASQTSFSSLGLTAFNSTPTFSSTGQLQSFYVNGGAVGTTAIDPPGIGSNTITLGSSFNSSSGNAKAEIFDIIVWQGPLTAASMMQVHRWACNKYAQTPPWQGIKALNVFFGDSIMAGVGGTNLMNSAPYLAAQALGLSYGQWHALGVGGINTSKMMMLAPSWIYALPSACRLPVNVIAFEWVNEGGSPPGPFNDGQSFLAACKAVSGIKTVWGTSTGYSGDPSTNRNTYNSAFDSASTTNIDSYMPFHNDTNIGNSTAFANNPSNFSDTIHLSNAGYVLLGTLLKNGIQALP